MSTAAHPLSVLVLAAVAHAGVGGHAILYLVVATSWIGVPIVGAAVLAAAGVLASDGELIRGFSGRWNLAGMRCCCPPARRESGATTLLIGPLLGFVSPGAK